ncbi:MAG TPA: low temperature requirement protein A [Acidimicrobiales bacterium]|nr:low temperature requirement protein A [Acidimicrobiales bacterium]
MAAPKERHPPRLSAVLREAERVTPLELFFDLVFVLAVTQCTALMADEPTWEGLTKGALVLGVLWWSWGGYAWLTSVVDPEEGSVRIAMFAAMAAFLVVSIAVPRAFENLAVTFAVAYGVVRLAHIALFLLASRDDPELRTSTVGLAVSTAIGVGLLTAASLLDGAAQIGVWALALVLDLAGPFFFGAEGWKLVPGHFAERHALIVIVALGESIVAIGVGAETSLTAGVTTAAAVAIALLAAMWWAYFDVDAAVAARHLAATTPGRERNDMARDAYSYMHFPMVLGIVLVALGLKKTLGHVGEPLDTVPTVALVGGVALYLLAHVAFRLRTARTVSGPRLLVAVALLGLVPAALEMPALLTLSAVTVGLCALITYETVRYAGTRDEVRHQHPG